MKAAPLLLAELASRGLLERSEKIAAAYHVALADVCSPARGSDVVAARRVIWIWQIDELGSQSAVARLWGVDHSSIVYAEQNDGREIVRVMLDEVDRLYRFEWSSGPGEPFTIVDLVAETRRGFPTYAQARAAWSGLLELVGGPALFRFLDARPPKPPPPSVDCADGGAS